MSNVGWTSRFRKGRNIAIENSFRITYENTSQQQATVGLFSLGSNNITQSANTQNNSKFSKIDFSSCVDANGLFTQPFRFQIWATYLGVNPVYNGISFQMVTSFLLPIGFNILNLPTINQLNFVYTIPDSGVFSSTTVARTNGQFSDLNQDFCTQWYIEAVEQVNSTYQLVFPNVAVNRIRIIDFGGTPLVDVSNCVVSQSALDVNNPFVQTTTQTNVPVSAIQQSSNGSSIGILCLDIYSTNQDQILQGVGYQYKDSNGDTIFFSADPIINPYQPQVGVISCLDLEMMQINVETTVSYNILPQTTALITYNYVRFTIWDYYEFDKVFAQQLKDNFLLQKRLLDRDRLSLLQIE